MLFNEFTHHIREAIISLLPDGTSVEIQSSYKNNDIRQTALIIHPAGMSVVPTIYLEPYYRDYEAGVNMSTLAESIVSSFYHFIPRTPISYRQLLDFDSIKNRLYLSIIGYESNIIRLQSLLHTRYLDFAVVFYATTTVDDCIGSIYLTNEILTYWDTTIDSLMAIALDNTIRDFPYKTISFDKLCMDYLDNSLDFNYNDLVILSQVLLLTNDKGHRGASCILYPDLLNIIAKKIDDDLYIVPSSIDEVIILPLGFVDDVKAMLATIHYVNNNYVRNENILSNNLYRFSRSTNELTIENG